ncbi:MAG: sulfur transferase domain-containing protein [Pseudomonadota bacterium]
MTRLKTHPCGKLWRPPPLGRALTVVLLFCLPLTHAEEPTVFSAPQTLDAEGFREVLARIAPGILIAGQPTPAGLRRAQAMGVTGVINLRTHMEMDDRSIVDFDEAALLEELGMTYIHIPLGGPDTPYNPAAVDALAEALEDDAGAILLHCTVAWRATHLWLAYLVRHHGYSVPAAVAVGRQLNLGTLPLEGFLGQPLHIGLKP